MVRIMRKILSLILSLAFAIGGLLLMIASEHPLAAVWRNPLLIFWDPQAGWPRMTLPWWIGFNLCMVGCFIIAEDWFGFDRLASIGRSASGRMLTIARQAKPTCSRDSAKRP